MDGIAFKFLEQQDGKALYSSTEDISGSTDRSALYYFVFLDEGVQVSKPIDDLEQCFRNDSAVLRGAFVFVDGTPPTPEALFAELNENLHLGTNPVTYPRLAWRQNAESYQTIEQSEAMGVPVAKQFPFGRWIVEVGVGSTIVQRDGDQISIQKAAGTESNSLTVIVEVDGNQEEKGSHPDLIDVPLSGVHTGGMLFDWEWQHRQLQEHFGGELRMFYGDGNTPATTIRYPLFIPPRDPGPRPTLDLAFKVTAHPLAALNGSRTRLALSPDPPANFNKLNAILMRTPTGSDVTLGALASGNTEDGAGFSFAKTAVSAGNTDFYLTPVGNFSVEKVLEKPSVQIMAGIAGSEFLLTEVGDILTFENNRAAFVKGFDPNSQGQPPLAADFTTSWVKVHKNGAQVAPDDKVVTTSYCAQPSSATYFARHAAQSTDDFSVAIGISLSQLAELAPEENPFFPFLPYGGVFFQDEEKGIQNPNPEVEAATVGAFEKQVIEPHRRALLEPTFDKTYGPIFFDAANNLAFQGGSARTPLGFIAQLNTSGENGKPRAGSWKALQLAQSPQNPTQFLELTANADGVVNPVFSNAVLRDNLFMVVPVPDLLWPNGTPGKEIQLGDFTFQVNIGTFDENSDKDQPRALAVFKFMPGFKFVDLIEDTVRWTSFFGDGDDATKVQSQIRGYIQAANTGGHLYDAFNSIVNDPDWTGMLVFNCPLDYKALPSDIQILLGGIDGTLRAHHFGVTINRVKHETNGAMSIENSSLFAVIDYKKDFDDKFENYPNFQVLLFNVEYANSKLVVFNSRIAFSIDELFGNPAKLTIAPPPIGDPPVGDNKETGTIVIDGVYTLHEDGTGSLVFVTHEERVFSFPVDEDKLRVLQAQSVDNAALVPVASTLQPDGSVKAVASFQLDGTLAFKDDIAGDLFSYGELSNEGVPDKGLVIVDYAFIMTTDIPAQAGRATLEKISTDLTGLKVDQARSESRKDSFNKTFPSNIDSLRYVEDDQGTSQTGAWQVQNDDLEDLAPTYMQHFKIPMGSLGGLVSSTNNIISDLYIGWISGGKSDADDRVGAVLVLPALVAGADGFNIQGIASSKFESVHLDRQEFEPSTGGGDTIHAYDLRFQHYSSSLLGIPLIYSNAPKDMGIFGSPADPGGDNAVWFVGKSEDTETWEKGLKIDFNIFEELPVVYIGRSFAIETDPTDPKVIDDAIDELNLLQEKTVAEHMAFLYANSGKYSSAAGMTFALKFEFKALDFAMLLHDNDFYGAKIKLEFGEEKENDGEEKRDDGEEKRDDGAPNMPAGRRDFYKVLGVTRDATEQQIKKAFRDLSLKSHPDKDHSPGATERYQVITDAYDALKNSDSRAKYDRDPQPNSQKKEDPNGGEIEDHSGEEKKDDGEEKKGLDKLQGFEFSIIYRKISEHLGVWAATIFIDVGDIDIGEATLTLPDFSVSIWTNGDWRFSVGWPLDDHPITLQFMAGPIPVIGKLGFYLAKLSSEDNPSKFLIPGDPPAYPPNFHLIWSFGLGISAGIGKEWKKGPFEAKASLSVVLTVEGFLASFDGNISKDGVDYYWWCISLALVGEVEGKVDFKIISASLSITLTLKLALALETLHSTALELTFEAEVQASIKIIFFTIHFSFSTTLTILDTSFGSGPDAQMDGPTPKAVADKLAPPKALPESRSLAPMAAMMSARSPELLPMARKRAERFARPMAMAARSFMAEPFAEMEGVAAEPVVPIEMKFLLLSTATSTDGTSWTPQGVASLVVENGDVSSPFGKLAEGLANWLLENYGRGATASFDDQLFNVELALVRGLFDDQVEACLSTKFVFSISGFVSEPSDPPPPAAVIPVHQSLGLIYDGKTIRFGSPTVPANYGDLVKSYFEQDDQHTEAATNGSDSVASLLFNEYFVMFAKQLVTDLQKEVEEKGAVDLAGALTEKVLTNVAGFVSRFLMGGIRLPVPADLTDLAPLYELTHQQFALINEVLEAKLIGSDSLPPWIKLDGDVSATLKAEQVYKVAPTDHPWTVYDTPPLSPVPARFPMNASLDWIDENGTAQTIFNFADSLHLAIKKWRDDPANTGQAGPWLKLEQVTGSTQQTTSSKSYSASGALVIPLSLKTIPKPGGKPGDVLDEIYSLVGTDEVHRAYLQALLEDPKITIGSLALMVNASQGKYTSTKTPKVLVRTNLSTSTAPSGAAAAAAGAVNEANAGGGGPYCANYAKPADLGELAKFLRLIWECSIVHTGGFYLQVEGLKPEQFKNGQASLQLVVQSGGSSETIEAEPYHNALIGAAPDEKYAVLANLNSDAKGTPVVTYTASYPAGNAGWSIKWNNAPIEVDATGSPADVLQGLYQMVSYCVTAIDGVKEKTNWSRPITALHDGTDGTHTWNYQKSFPTAPLLGNEQNTYAAVGKKVDVAISIEDIFGNSLTTTPQTLVVVYNDDILGLANWVGTQANYQFAESMTVGKVQLTVNFSYSSLQNPLEYATDKDKLQRTLAEYVKISNQLNDPNLSAAIDTGSLLASDPLADAGGNSVVSTLQHYVDGIVSWLSWLGGDQSGTPANVPEPMSLQFEVDKDYPLNWDGDLRELRISLLLMRAGVDRDIAAKAPQVQQVSSPITPVQGKSTADDPTGLSAFALTLEKAYYQFDGKADGVIKVATGVNSDLKSSRLGMQSLWLARWGKTSGISVQILNDDTDKPVYYATPPLSAQLITREVKDLLDYSETPPRGIEKQVFSSIDIDRLAASFLSSVENIFSPQIAPPVAYLSADTTEDDKIYDSYVDGKTSLASSIADKLAYIYQSVAADRSDPASAIETMRQALLHTLENDYGISTLVQMAAEIGLHGDIEPGSSSPPNLYGNIIPTGSQLESADGESKPLPYNFSPAKLPLRQGKAWLNFLLSVQDPAAQKALKLALDYQMGFIEHEIDPAATRCDYTPSNWLTFILQQNEKSLPQGPQNTLTAPMGTPRIPIPLRSYPPLPKLLAASAKQDIKPESITRIEDALCWTYELTVARPSAAQDTLNLMVTFNEPPEDGEDEQPAAMRATTVRGQGDLFDALARYMYEYPQLEPDIQALADGGTPKSDQALKDFRDLVSDVAAAWPAWNQPQPPVRKLLQTAGEDHSHQVWTYVIDQEPEDQPPGSLSCTRSWSRQSADLPPWPNIEGYQDPLTEDKETKTWVYKLKPQTDKPVQLKLTWEKFYVLDYQSARASAFIERNRNLGGDTGEQTNDVFVYRTETVKMPSSAVPLIKAPQTLQVDSGSSLEAAITSMFVTMHTMPEGSIGSDGTKRELRLEGSISYSFRLLDNLNSNVRSFLPLFLMQSDIQPEQDTAAASQVAKNMDSWREETNPKIDQSSISFRLTLFATKIVQGAEQLPLVQFQDLSINVPDNWWPTVT